MPSGSMNGCEANVVYPATRINCPKRLRMSRSEQGFVACVPRRRKGILAAPREDVHDFD